MRKANASKIDRIAAALWLSKPVRGLGAYLIVFIVAAALGACATARSRHQPVARSAAAQHSSRTCSASETKRIVRQVVRAFNADDSKTLDSLVGQPSAFRWFSAPGPQARLGDAAYQRPTLTEYVRRRHRHREQLTILRFNTSDRADGNFGLAIVRQADDYRRRVVDAKGKVECTLKTSALIAWSIGSHPTVP